MDRITLDHPDMFSIVYRPVSLSYSDFILCNDKCFNDELFSEEEFICHRDREFWGAYLENELIGFGISMIHKNEFIIRRIGICPEHRGKSYGQYLFSMMVNKGKQAGCDRLTVSVQQDNPVAIHIYEKFDFKIMGQSFQYIIDFEQLGDPIGHSKNQNIYELIPILECDLESLPEKMRTWHSAQGKMSQKVFMFKQSGRGFTGFCRFDPEFPGCSPFEVWQPDFDLKQLLLLLDEYLLPGKNKIKLTFSNPQIAEAAKMEGYMLNYKLFDMVLSNR